MKRLFLLLALSAATGGCATFTFFPSGAQRPSPSAETRYDELYPYYAEVCAASQLNAVNEDVGGTGGHEVLYLRGACRKAGAAYPTIEMCPARSESSRAGEEAQAGVGISADKIFKNVNWVAIPDRKIFYEGALEGGVAVTPERVREAEKTVSRQGWFQGIQIHEKYLEKKRPEMSEEDFIAHKTIGTDYALNFSRSMLCVKIPVKKAMMGKMVEFLNQLNASYASGGATYEWDVYRNNCAHIIHNALAAAGIGKPKKVKSRWLQFFYLAVPSNEFEDLTGLSGQGPLEKFGRIYGDKILRKSLLEDNWLPMQHGVLLRQMDIRAREGAEVEKTKILIMDVPLWRTKSRRIRKMLADKRYTDLQSNLIYFRDRYQAILKDRPVPDKAVKPKNERAEVLERYYGYIEESLKDAEDKRAQIQ